MSAIKDLLDDVPFDHVWAGCTDESDDVRKRRFAHAASLPHGRRVTPTHLVESCGGFTELYVELQPEEPDPVTRFHRILIGRFLSRLAQWPVSFQLSYLALILAQVVPDRGRRPEYESSRSAHRADILRVYVPGQRVRFVCDDVRYDGPEPTDPAFWEQSCWFTPEAIETQKGIGDMGLHFWRIVERHPVPSPQEAFDDMRVLEGCPNVLDDYSDRSVFDAFESNPFALGAEETEG